MLRGEVEGAELESLAAEHNIVLEKSRCVMYFYSAQTSTEDASTILEGVIDPENDVLTEVGRHSLALMKTLDEDMDFEALSQMTERWKTPSSWKPASGVHRRVRAAGGSFPDRRGL